MTGTLTMLFALSAVAADGPAYEPAADSGKSEVTLPQIVRKVEPTWPVGLLGLKLDSSVTIQAVIGTDGVPREITVLSSSDERLNDPAMDAVRQWRYRPAIQRGQPVAMYFTIVLRANPRWMPRFTVPRRIVGSDPEYPPSLLPEKLNGEVEVQLKIGIDGEVIESKVIASDHPAFTEASMTSIAASKYVPAMSGGKPVVGYMNVNFDFRWKKAARGAGNKE